MLLFLLGLCCSVACVISLARGGAFMLSNLRSQSEDGCSVSELKGVLQKGLSSFRCEDGHLDVKHEGTVNILRAGWSSDAVEVYRMAPVYLREASPPVAWAVAKDRPLIGAVCGHGLCGLFLQPREDEAVLLRQLTEELLNTLGFSKEKHYHLHNSLQSLPLVALTDPSNPFGSRQMLFWAAVFYFLALLTLLAFQMEFRASNNDYELLATKSPDTDTEERG